MSLTQSQRGKILGGIAGTLFVAFTVESAITGRIVDRRAKELHADLVMAYGHTDRDDAALLAFDDAFLARSGHSPDGAAEVDDGVRARFRVSAWTENRCVLVHWTDDGVDVSGPRSCSP